MVSFPDEVLHVCQGKCPKCLGNFENHMLSVHGSCADLILCDACGRKFNNKYCFETHRSNVLEGEFKSFCNFLSVLKHCESCRKDFSLVLKCKHFGKKKKSLHTMGKYFFSNSTPLSKRGFVKCGYCSDYQLKGGGGEGHSCFLKRGNSIFGSDSHRSSTIRAHNVFCYDIETRLEDRFECRFQSIDENGNEVSVR